MAVSLGIDMAKEMGITKLEIQMDNEACYTMMDGNDSGYESSLPRSTPSTVSPSPVPNSMPPPPPRPPLYHSQSNSSRQQSSSRLGEANEPEVQPEPSELTSSRKGRKLTSPVWNHFERITVNDQFKAKCIHCNKLMSANTTNGTSNLNDHLTKRCTKKNQKVDIR
ncbi:uncharacterized protein [Spinacia oleracea]|uniref:BED-type domain-containing protein n=1 Tax=Spinacia oleracea TaxID=3562 RepID=A0ABM3RRB9_SPIOL|nr:uncharacterized protein LOC130471857 [Spinacia oleracea]